MPSSDLDHEELIKTLTDNFNILADEVQLLSDRKVTLEHKLRFAHEQVSTYYIISYLPRAPSLLYDEKLSSRSGAANAATTDNKYMYPDFATRNRNIFSRPALF
jgi:hypothetical protein